MKNEQELNAKIFNVTETIREQYPEIYSILNEMPVTMPDAKVPVMNTRILREYHESLMLLLNKYLAAHQ